MGLLGTKILEKMGPYTIINADCGNKMFRKQEIKICQKNNLAIKKRTLNRKLLSDCSFSQSILQKNFNYQMLQGFSSSFLQVQNYKKHPLKRRKTQHWNF